MPIATTNIYVEYGILYINTNDQLITITLSQCWKEMITFLNDEYSPPFVISEDEVEIIVLSDFVTFAINSQQTLSSFKCAIPNSRFDKGKLLCQLTDDMLINPECYD